MKRRISCGFQTFFSLQMDQNVNNLIFRWYCWEGWRLDLAAEERSARKRKKAEKGDGEVKQKRKKSARAEAEEPGAGLGAKREWRSILVPGHPNGVYASTSLPFSGHGNPSHL